MNGPKIGKTFEVDGLKKGSEEKRRRVSIDPSKTLDSLRLTPKFRLMARLKRMYCDGSGEERVSFKLCVRCERETNHRFLRDGSVADSCLRVGTHATIFERPRKDVVVEPIHEKRVKSDAAERRGDGSKKRRDQFDLQKRMNRRGQHLTT